MQDSCDEHFLTPELMEILNKIVTQVGVKFDVDLVPEVPGFSSYSTSESQPCRPNSCVNGSEPSAIHDQSNHFRMDTPSHRPSSSRDSLESYEAAVSHGFQLSPTKPKIPARVDYSSSVHHPSLASGAPTTLMLKNIPNKVSREELIGEILFRMPPGSINFFYLPRDFKTHTNFGYAFLNCTSDLSVETFVSTFHKRRLASAAGVYSKPMEVTIARVQGFTANINRLISSPVLFEADEGSLPLIFNSYQISIPFRSLMHLNRASILFQTRPPIEDLIAMVEAEMQDH